jgi:GNAT superfamily N-acetyltransferase
MPELTIREVLRNEHHLLIPLLLQAEPSERALRWSLRNLSDTAYRMDEDGHLVAAATMRWRDDPSELVELAVAPERHGQGLGHKFVAYLAEEGRRRGKKSLIVGTSSTSADNLLFYQKAGFRIDAVRHDYFWYYDPPLYENGLPVRDMIVFRMQLH